ncbi:interactor protein for cytohesin exchange factors 1 isoform X2 [Myotis daubentonii]|uniref:interactor protein for cytohesin exchange factors 1 isoform X2 n=1 Tax=Myotis daubentonii TaxID=98922 RepID=UPI00287339DD|nr:interactor protein for cytohesin exchange factors 1 isoform X2 [Myotis daubentonii]
MERSDQPKKDGIGGVGEGLSTGTLVAVPSVLSPESPTPVSPHRTLDYSALSQPKTRIRGNITGSKKLIALAFVSANLESYMASDGNLLVPLRQKPGKKTQGFFTMSRRRISCKDLGHADCQGWLYKKKEKGTFLSNKWKKFWVVLKASSLYWYSNQLAEKAEGFVNLPDFTVEKASECRKKHAFKISHPQIKTFYFAAENTQEMNVWLNKLGLSVTHHESTTKDEECYSESEQDDPEIAVETALPPISSETLSPLAAEQASSSSSKLSETPGSFSSLENTVKAASTLPTSCSKERQSLTDINSSSAAEDVGQSIAIAVEIHPPGPSETDSHKALEKSLATSESGALNSLSGGDTSSLSSNLDHLTVPDKPTGSKMIDREETKVSGDDEMEKLYKSLEQASLSPLGDRRPSTKKELRKSFVRRCKNPSINEKLHKIRTLNSTLKCKEHDLAMINQLLDDPKLTARKYREWKVMNTMLIQDIYQQQQDPASASAPAGSP